MFNHNNILLNLYNQIILLHLQHLIKFFLNNNLFIALISKVNNRNHNQFIKFMNLALCFKQIKNIEKIHLKIKKIMVIIKLIIKNWKKLFKKMEKKIKECLKKMKKNLRKIILIYILNKKI